MNIIYFLNRDDNKQWLIVAVVCVAVIFATVMLFSSNIPRRVRAPEIDNRPMLQPAQQAQQPLQPAQQQIHKARQVQPANGMPVAMTGATPRMMALQGNKAPNAMTTATPSIITWMNTIIDADVLE